jgi:hypothetical protein
MKHFEWRKSLANRPLGRPDYEIAYKRLTVWLLGSMTTITIESSDECQ